MITFNRVASVTPGKTAAAIAFGKEISAHMKSTCHVDLEMLVPVNGKILGDKKCWEILNKNSDLFLAGSIHDSMWRTV